MCKERFEKGGASQFQMLRRKLENSKYFLSICAICARFYISVRVMDFINLFTQTLNVFLKNLVTQFLNLSRCKVVGCIRIFIKNTFENQKF